MSKGFKLLLVGLAVAVLVGAVGVGAVLAADPPTSTSTTPADFQKAFIAKVAQILGVDQQKLTDAIKQAAKETRNEMIDKAVAEGRITQEWGNWLKQRPDNGGLGLGFGFKGMHGGKWFGGWHGRVVPKATPTPSQ